MLSAMDAKLIYFFLSVFLIAFLLIVLERRIQTTNEKLDAIHQIMKEK